MRPVHARERERESRKGVIARAHKDTTHRGRSFDGIAETISQPYTAKTSEQNRIPRLMRIYTGRGRLADVRRRIRRLMRPREIDKDKNILYMRGGDCICARLRKSSVDQRRPVMRRGKYRKICATPSKWGCEDRLCFIPSRRPRISFDPDERSIQS